MRKKRAIELFESALSYCEENSPEEIAWAKSVGPETFRRMKSRRFLSEYCWVVYASGFRVSVLTKLFPELTHAFKNFDLDALSRTRSIRPVLQVFNNQRKAESFLKGVKLIAEEGFSNFKQRMISEGVDGLDALPGIGKITKSHLAKNIGLADVAKPDIWLVRAADLCGTTVDPLVSFLSQKYELSQHVVDLVIWRYGADQGVEH